MSQLLQLLFKIIQEANTASVKCLSVVGWVCLPWYRFTHISALNPRYTKHSQWRTRRRLSLSNTVFHLFPGAISSLREHSWHPEAQRGSILGWKQCPTLDLARCLVTNYPSFPPFWPWKRPASPRLERSEENDLFEGWSGSFECGFSSRSVSQRCVSVWSAARASIQECELAEDIIKAMSALIHGLTFKSPCSLRATVVAEYHLLYQLNGGRGSNSLRRIVVGQRGFRCLVSYKYATKNRFVEQL